MTIDFAAIRSGRHEEIAEVLERNGESITDEWSVRARSENSEANASYRDELRNRLPGFVQAMGAALRRVDTSATGEHRLLAVEHGEQRWQIGWTLASVVADYQILRTVLLERLDQEMERGLDLTEAMAVGYFLDDAIQAAVVTFTEHQETQLRRSHQRLNEFLSVLGHELRNPLAAIKTGMELLKLRTEEDHSRVFEVVGNQVDTTTRLLDDIMDVSRITRGQVEMKRETVRVWPIIESAAQSARSMIVSHQHALTMTPPGEELWINADATRLQQVVTNLLTNAAKYTEDGGEIFVAVTRDENEAVITVRDTGTGIDPSDLPHIFDLFVQSPENTGRGLGIGLALARLIVEMHGGTISACSDGAGRGSEFTVCLPLVRDVVERRLSPDVDEVLGGDLSGTPARSILVVDDESATAQMLAALLEQFGHEVFVAFDGEEAAELAHRHQPEVILTDIGLPGMDGYALARAVRADEGTKEALLIAMSGYAHQAQQRHADEAGFDKYLVKPIDLRSVQETISAANR